MKKNKMTTQTPISARIDDAVLWAIDQEAMTGQTTRNRILNKGGQMYCIMEDLRRSFRMHESRDVRRKILRGFLKLYWPEAVDEL